MPIDLYVEVYKRFYQRSNRSPDDWELSEMTEIARELVHNLFKIQTKGSISQEDINLTLTKARSLLELETNYGRFGVLLSRRLLRALEADDFEILVPKHKMSSWLEEESHWGTLYILTAKSRPGQCKLGVTQGNLEERVSKYQHRHHCSVDIYFSQANIPTPYRYEQEITKKFLNQKNSNNADAQSNEWFFLDPKVLKKEIMQIKVKVNPDS